MDVFPCSQNACPLMHVPDSQKGKMHLGRDCIIRASIVSRVRGGRTGSAELADGTAALAVDPVGLAGCARKGVERGRGADGAGSERGGRLLGGSGSKGGLAEPAEGPMAEPASDMASSCDDACTSLHCQV